MYVVRHGGGRYARGLGLEKIYIPNPQNTKYFFQNSKIFRNFLAFLNLNLTLCMVLCILVCKKMARINLSVPAMKLKTIDLYCKDRNISRSELMTNCTLTFINSTKRNVRCEFQNCRQAAVGKYKLVVYDHELGEQEKELHLCSYHLNKARKEGASVRETD